MPHEEPEKLAEKVELKSTPEASSAASDGAATDDLLAYTRQLDQGSGVQPEHRLTHSIELARDCRGGFDEMIGNDCIRRCRQCQLWVIKTDNLTADGLVALYKDNPLPPAESSLTLAALGKTRLFRRSDGTFVIGDCYPARNPHVARVLIVLLAPLLLYGLTQMVAPSYVNHMWYNPTARLAGAGCIVWHMFGVWLFSRSHNPISRTIIFVICTFPLLFFIMFGPSLVSMLDPLRSDPRMPRFY